tara:strand:+ start:1113 stop:1688 length:576 start_codon:yes stop_codon:yes gene_type:complete
MNALTRKLIRDYTYNSESLEDILSISSDAEAEFRDALNNGHEDALKALQPKEGSIPPKKIEEIDEVKFEDKKFKKIFRKLAIKCHPDKLTKDISEKDSFFLKKCYEQINIANSTYDWGLLLKVSNWLDVEVTDLSEEHFDNINSNIESIKRKISMYENSMAYKWYTLSDPEIKKGYLETCAAIFMKEVNKT